MLIRAGDKRSDIHPENAGSEIHRATFQTGERKNRHMAGRHVAVFSTHRTLVAYKIRVCTGKTRRTNSLMRIDHDLMVGSLTDSPQVVVNRILVIVILTLGKNITHISALHRIIAITIHQIIGLIHPALIVRYRAGSLMVHHQLDTL